MNNFPPKQQDNGTWYVYLLRCSDKSLYTGVTTDLQRRVDEHNSPASVTRYTRSRRPVLLVYAEYAKDRSGACSREHQIKKLSKKSKESLLASPTNILNHTE